MSPLCFAARLRGASIPLLASAAALAAAAPAGAVGTQQLSATSYLSCSTPAADLPGAFRLTITGTAPTFSAPGEIEHLTNVHAAVSFQERPGAYGGDPGKPYLTGRVMSVGLSVAGATPNAVTLDAPASATFAGTIQPATTSANNSYGPFSFDLPDLPALTTSGTDSVVVSLDALTFQEAASATPDPPAGDATTIACQSPDPLLALPNVAGTTGTQAIDATIPLTCTSDFGDPGAAGALTLGLKAAVPATSSAGGQNAVVTQGLTLRRIGAAGDTSEGFILAQVTDLTYAIGAGIYQTAGGVATERVQRTNGSWGPVTLTPSLGIPPSPIAGSGPLTVRLAGLRYSFNRTPGATGPIPPLPPSNGTCTVDAGQPALATIAATAPASAPVVTRVYGVAWAGIGGLIRVHGSKLAGAKYVTLGTKKVRPLLVAGSTDVWVLAPPLPKGTYPVAVGTATAVSAPGAGNSTTINYR